MYNDKKNSTSLDSSEKDSSRSSIAEEVSGLKIESIFPGVQIDKSVPIHYLIEALKLRKEYMDRIGSDKYSETTKCFLNNTYSQYASTFNVKQNTKAPPLAYHPPEPEPDHWGLKKSLPKYETKYIFKREGGITRIYDKNNELVKDFEKYYISKVKFLKDYEKMLSITSNGPLKTFCYRRLMYLQNKFQLYLLHNEQYELHEQKTSPHRDFYNVRKVDTHIHASSSMNQKHLLRFIKRKVKNDKNNTVLEKNGVKLTLGELFKRLKLDPYDLNVDMMDCHADKNTFHRFDTFNTKYNPLGVSDLKQIFMKYNNYVEGKYFAEILKEVFKDLEDSKYQHIEPRISIHGLKNNEWNKLATWAIKNDVWSTNAKFLIQIPRVYDEYKAVKEIDNFGHLLNNIFTPLFEVTNDPSVDPYLFKFLQQITGFDCVDDESKHEYINFDKYTPDPDNYTESDNPSYTYYMFYLYSNICMLNGLRRSRGLNTFSLRPHCGEAGAVNHLISGYLTAESIAHGLLLRKSAILQYLFYLTQMGIAMSPLSNNLLFVPYQRNPFPEFFMKGLNISLSTDDPLMFHFTREALMEEYSIAIQVWKLSPIDMCEIAKNSVHQSGFDDKIKMYWLGSNWKKEGIAGNDISRTNIPDSRISMRHELLVEELTNIFNNSNN
uniref:AMP deaminase n=1 Tax=Parastrongyloides trichosuri TaxID=131310 RepID=A0A0N4ZU19_PARTI